MRVAAVQFRPEFKAVQRNLKVLGALVTQAASQGAEVIVLPELCTTGYSFMSRADAEPFASTLRVWPATGVPVMEFMHGLAKQHTVCIAFGAVEKDMGTGDLYNSQVLMTPSGSFISYRKANLWGNDFLWAKEGNENPPVTQIRGRDGTVKKLGLLICRDARDKKDAHWEEFYEPGDADIVCFSANWGDGGFPSITWMSFVKDNKCAMVVSNRYGQETPNNFGEGGICVIRRDQSIVTEGLRWNEDCTVFDDV